ncbi:hypothetical protein ACFVRU_51615, partial [Streptomyces sp. NPDC057927]
LEEVVLRLRGLLRRAGAEPLRADDSVLVLGDLVLSEQTREVRRDGTPIQLTAKEFDLLGRSSGRTRPPSWARARSCSTRWTRTARRTATTSR